MSLGVAEAFKEAIGLEPPVIMSGGAARSVTEFCRGAGQGTSDVLYSWRALSDSEFALCNKSGVTPIEIKLGSEAVVFGTSVDGNDFNFSGDDIYKALARNVMIDGEIVPNPFSMWSEINPDLPDVPIEVIGPSPDTPQYQAFTEFVLSSACPEGVEREACLSLRDDGTYKPYDGNPQELAAILSGKQNSVAIGDYSFLANLENLKLSPVNGVMPSPETIFTGEYKGARSVYFYAKEQNIGVTEGLDKFIVGHTSPELVGRAMEPIGVLPFPNIDTASSKLSVASTKDGTEYVSYTPAEMAFKGAPAPDWEIRATRSFAGAHDYPPNGFGAYGIVAFPARPTAGTIDRFRMICEAFVSALTPSDRSTLAIDAQMVTVWPVETEAQAHELNQLDNGHCDLAIKHYSRDTAQAAIDNAAASNRTVRGQGPFLLAWSPSDAARNPPALVLMIDMSDVQNESQAQQIFEFWRKEIEEETDLWKDGWSIELVLLKARFLADNVGAILFGPDN